MTLLGIISDTHGLLREEAVEALRGADLILHAGDIGKPEVISSLQSLAPVVAVRGNVDHGAWAAAFPSRRAVTVERISILMLHDRKELKTVPPDQPVQVIVSGHSHVPSISEEEGILYLNPGSAGRKRFHLPITVALLHVDGGEVRAEIVHLLQ